MSLRQKQSEFAHDVGELLLWSHIQGYEVTLAEAYRPRDVARLYYQQGRGILSSLHCQRLAIDLNLFVGGKYMTKSEAYRPLGEYWKSIRPAGQNCWGGDFRNRDGVHFSRTHGGRK